MNKGPGFGWTLLIIKSSFERLASTILKNVTSLAMHGTSVQFCGIVAAAIA